MLAAGGSRRLGRPKQLLPYGGRTLLDHTLATARACQFAQVVVVLGGNAEEVREAVDVSGVDVVENRGYGQGCASSIGAGVGAVDARCRVLVLMLGDQPGVSAETVRALLAGRDGAPLAVCRYEDGRGHPFAFDRTVFGELEAMHGDKAVWKLLERRAGEVAEVAVPGPIPPDVDTWEDYEAVLSTAGSSR